MVEFALDADGFWLTISSVDTGDKAKNFLADRLVRALSFNAGCSNRKWLQVCRLESRRPETKEPA